MRAPKEERKRENRKKKKRKVLFLSDYLLKSPQIKGANEKGKSISM